MRGLAALLVCFGLAACGEPAPKSGVMPGIAGGPYEAPKNAEAAAAYMAGFHARYDIPELDYPQDIKDRIRAARNKRFIRDMEVAEKRQVLMSKLALTVLAQKDPEAKEVLKKLKGYEALGIESFILSGYPHKEECDLFARYVLPELDHACLTNQ